MKKMSLAVAVLFTCWAGTANAEDAVAHFHGKTFDSLDEAVKSLVIYNKRLHKTVDQESLSAADLNAVHELTYTLENALEKIGEELEILKETLEEIHLASEAADGETVKAASTTYFEISDSLFGDTHK